MTAIRQYYENEKGSSTGLPFSANQYYCMTLSNYLIINKDSTFCFVPGCDRRPSDCAIFDFTYVGSYDHNHDASEWCAEPDNILCVSQVAPPLPAPTSADTLHVAAYNTWERPFWITLDGQRERTCRIPRQMASHWPNIDVITFQV